MREIEATGHARTPEVAEIAGIDSEAFARQLHRRHAPDELPSAGHIVLPRDTLWQRVNLRP